MNSEKETLLYNLEGTVFNGCTLERELGRGNNGIVYLARQQLLDRQVACKLLLPERAEEQGFIDSFFREARTAAKLSHPNVVQALDVGCSDGLYFFIMEYVDGESLEDMRLNSPEKVTPKLILQLSIQLANALQYAWTKFSMTHGDIKPENLMICRSSRQLKLADLGLARISGSGEVGEIMATPLYVSPEVITNGGNPPDPRSDIYSFGVMLYELNCGKPPFDGDMELLLNRHLTEKPRPLLTRNPDMDPEFANFIDTMLEKDPEKRPGSWFAVETVLQRIYDRLYPAKSVPVQTNNSVSKLFADIDNSKNSDSSKMIPAIIIAALLAITCGAIAYWLVAGK